ncbi:MAG: hypothetical protein L0219_16310 [Phycisphaerales bacterium]|nr:hypothetical protein [Phycisphaerales bacterium]
MCTQAQIQSGWWMVCLILMAIISDSTQASSAMIAYGKFGSTSPRYQIWNGSAWGAETAANSVGSAPQWVVLRGSPALNAFALATLDDNHDIEVQTWNGTLWSSVFQATDDAGTKDRRVFDLAYEQVSGHLLLVYRENATNQVRYRTYDGLAWSSEGSYTMTANNVRWLQLVPKPGTDQMLIIAISDNDKIHKAARWNGSGFTNLVDLVGIDEPGTKREHADGAYEGVSGQGLVAHNQDTNSPAYRTLNGGSWSSSQSAPSVGGQTQWTRLASDFVSDEIIMVTLDQANDINITVWNGSSWGTPIQIESDTAYTDRRAMDVAYECDGNEALVAYDDDTNTLKYRTWNGAGWSAELPGPTGGDAPLFNPQTVTGLVTGQIFVTYCTDNKEIRTAVWDGSSFGSGLLVATSSGDKDFETFMVAVACALPRVVSWQEVKP